MKFEYDKSADVLYVTLDDCSAQDCRFIENENGDVLKVSKRTGEIVGVTIMSFMLRIDKGFEVNVPEIGPVPFKRQAAQIIRQRRRA